MRDITTFAGIQLPAGELGLRFSLFGKQTNGTHQSGNPQGHQELPSSL